MDPPAPVLAAPSRSGRRRFPAGWTMLGAATVANYMSAPGQSYSVAAFKEPMRESLRLSETDYALAYAAGTILSGLMVPIIGRLLDRYGARRVLPLVGAMLGCGCLCMSNAAGLGGVFLGFSVIRVFGQGALCLVATWLVGEWFQRRRGFATAAAGMGGSVSVMTFPLLNGFLIATFGWQTAWAVLGVLVWLIVVLPSALLVRDRPEDLGLMPDEIDPSVPARAEQTRQKNEAHSGNWATRDVLRDVTFWKLLSVPATSGMVGTGLVFHQVSLLGSRGISAPWALGLISVQALVATSAVLGAGWLTDRHPNRYLLSTAMYLLAAAVAILIAMSWTGLAVVYAALLGLHGSILRSTGMVVWMNYYGRKNQGTIRGIAMAVMILAAALGPLPVALSFDQFESYDAALWIFLLVPLIAAQLARTGRPPQSPRRQG